MRSLFKVNINWATFTVIALLMLLVFPALNWYSYLALVITLHQFFLLFYSIGEIIPVRYLFGTFMCLQMFIGPLLAYNGIDEYQYFMYQMQVPEVIYFSYALPAVILFILGLHINAKKLDGEIPDHYRIKLFADQNPKLAYWFIAIGFAASLATGFIYPEFAFVFYLLGGLKYIGAFLLILGDKRLKIGPLILIYGSIILSSLEEGMFHDLLTWLIMLGAVLAIKYKPGNILKLITAASFILFVVVLQQLKGSYRAATGRGEVAGFETFQKAYQKQQAKDGFFNVSRLAASSVRINQGFIITYIMKRVPDQVPFSNGAELKLILEAAFLPRFMAPDKLNAGDTTLFMKYSGLPIGRGTSMGLSSPGDAYINFGILGGSVFMFFLGIMYSEILNVFHRYGKTYPILILFVTLVFYYPIRPDCELQTSLGHLVKSCFLIFAMLFVWRNRFRLSTKFNWKKSTS